VSLPREHPKNEIQHEEGAKYDKYNEVDDVEHRSKCIISLQKKNKST